MNGAVLDTINGLAGRSPVLDAFGKFAANDGVFVLEAEVPPALTRESSIAVWKIEADRVMLGLERHDPVTQTSEQMEVWITEQGIRMFPSPTRYAWPAELDLMARLRRTPSAAGRPARAAPS